MRPYTEPQRQQKGQAVILVLVALSLFLIGAIGLAIDGSHLYAQRQMAQAAADAAAQAGIMSVYNSTNTSGGSPDFKNAFGTTSVTCPAYSAGGTNLTPCYYAYANGFDKSKGDNVQVDFSDTDPGVVLSPKFSPKEVIVTVTRPVNTTLMQLLGSKVSNVAARAVAAIVTIPSPIPILILCPNNALCRAGKNPAIINKNSPSFYVNGNATLQICGGPQRSIQVNTSDTNALSGFSNSMVDLSLAGPNGDATCDKGANEGGDFGAVDPTPYSPPAGLNLGTAGKDVQPSSVMLDPLAGVAEPDAATKAKLAGPLTDASFCMVPAAATGACYAGSLNVTKGTLYGCPVASCRLYFPGHYTSASDWTKSKDVMLFAPGLYYIDAGANFIVKQTGAAALNATGFPDDTANATGQGVVFYLQDGQFGTDSGGGGIGRVGSPAFTGAPITSKWLGMLFFESRSASAHSHNFGGGACYSVQGTLYAHNTTLYNQAILLHGTPCGTTNVQGEIIADALQIVGTTTFKMALNPDVINVHYVALVH